MEINSFEKLRKLVDYADSLYQKKDTLDNLPGEPTQADFDKLPQEEKDYHKDLEGYIKYIETQNTVARNAIRTKLAERKTLCNQEGLFTSADKTQFVNEADVVINSIPK